MQMMCKNALCKTYVDIDDPGKALRFLRNFFSPIEIQLSFRDKVWTYSTDSYSAISLYKTNGRTDMLSKGFELQGVLQTFI